MKKSPTFSCPDKEFRLLHDEETVVGRKECRVLINGDCSISRVHAKIFTQADGTVYLTDLSKYGTSVNNNKLNKDQRYQLKEGDLIKFGNQPNKSEFRLVRLVEELIFCCSNMNANQKMEVKRSAIKLGAAIVDTWTSSCTHLIMNTITVTVKVANALSSLKPIITPKWVEDYVTAIRNGTTIPDHADYLPEVVDQNCTESKECFLPNESRSHLLLDKIFYFLTEKQYDRLRGCITNCGGRCHPAASRESVDELEELVSDNAIVMSVDGNTLSLLDHDKKEWVQQVLSFVKSKGYRTIIDSEVGLALIHVSTEQYCNPLSHQQVMDSLPPPTLSQQRDIEPPPARSSLSNITVYADDTLYGSEASEVLNSTLRTKNIPTSYKAPVKREIEEEKEGTKEVPVSLSMPPDASVLSQSATDNSKYFEPQDNSVGTKCTPVEVGGNEEKLVPSLDGLSCSPSTFHPSPTASTSVIVPGTFTQKSSKEKDVKEISNFFSSRKRKKQAEIDLTDVVDLTVDEAPSPKTSTANTSVNIYNVLAKRQKRGTDSRSKLIGSSLRKPRTDMTSELEQTRNNNIGINKEAPDFEVVCSSGDNNPDIRENRGPEVVINGNSSVNDDAIQEVDSMETSGSQRPKLSRFQRFTQRKANGFISARVTRADGLVVEQCDDDGASLLTAPAVLCEHVSLVVHRAAAVTEATLDSLSAATGVVNFKRFKKARYIGMGGLPTIIGSTELVHFDRETTTLTQEWQRGHEELESPLVREETDPFEMSGSSRRKR